MAAYSAAVRLTMFLILSAPVGVPAVEITAVTASKALFASFRLAEAHAHSVSP